MLRSIPIRVLCYLDILVLSSSPAQAARDMALVTEIFQNHGFSINWDKSHLVPSTRLLHLGAVIDSSKGQVFLSPDRVQGIKDMVHSVLTQGKVLLLLLLQLLGKMVSCFAIVPCARNHTRPLQWFLLPFQRTGCSTSNHKVNLPPQIRPSLCWWTSPALLLGCYFLELERLVITLDVSLHGWGAHLHDQVTQCQWSPAERQSSINFLELHAIRLALKHFRPSVEGQHILVLTDNVSAKAHVNREPTPDR